MSENQTTRRIICAFAIVTISGFGIVAFGQTAQPAMPLPVPMPSPQSPQPSPPPFQALRYFADPNFLRYVLGERRRWRIM